MLNIIYFGLTKILTWIETLITLLLPSLAGFRSLGLLVSFCDLTSPGGLSFLSCEEFWLALGVDSFPEGGGPSPWVGEDRLWDRLPREEGEVRPGLVTMSCFSTTILLTSLVLVNWIPLLLHENGSGASLKYVEMEITIRPVQSASLLMGIFLTLQIYFTL